MDSAMKTRRIRWGILGTQWISETMATGIKESDTAELTAIASRDIAKAKLFAEKHAVPVSYGDYDALLADPNIDAVYIGLPNHLHKEWIIRCAKAGKHILCEKPLVLNDTDAREAFTIAADNNVFCMEGLMYRHHPLTHQLETLMANKTIGDIQFINATYAANIASVANPTAGGAIRNLGCYPLSSIRLLVKKPVVNMIARGNNHIATTIITFENDVIATITTSDISGFQWQLDIVGTTGTIRMHSNPWCPDKHSEFDIIREGKEPERIIVKAHKTLFSYQVDVLGNHLHQNKLNPGDDAITWEHSIGNADLINQWLKQVKP